MMMKDRWYAILESSDVKSGHPVGLKRLGQNLVVWRDTGGQVHALRDRCPHRGASLSLGKIVDNKIECPFHAFCFDVTGKCTEIPAHGPGGKIPKLMRVPAYSLTEDFGWIFLWWGEPRAAYPPLEYFNEVTSLRLGSSLRDRWNSHITRAIENQLDMLHVPIVHKTTIGRGMDRRLEVATEVHGERVRFYRVGEEISKTYLEWIAPNLWLNRITAKLAIVLAFIPEDDDHTWM